MSYIHPNRVRQLFFIAILVLLSVVLFRELKHFIPAFLGAFTFYVLLRKPLKYLLNKGWRKGLAVAFLMVLSFLVIFLPFFTIIEMLSGKISYVAHHWNQIMHAIIEYSTNLEGRLGVNLLNQDNLKQLATITASKVPGIIGAALGSLTTFVILYFILYFMLTQGDAMEKAIYRFLPVARRNVKEVREEVNSMVLSNAIGIPVIAIFQGTIALIGYLLIGVKEPMLWFVVTCFTAMIPVVGGALTYVPLAIVFFANNETTRGILLLVYCFGIVGTVDNVFRFWLQKKIGDVHPLITVFGVVIGIELFGFVGVIFGPLLISLFLLLLELYQLEYSGDPEKQPIAPKTD